MERDDTTNLLLETIRKELISIIDVGSENMLEESKNKKKELTTSQPVTPPISHWENLQPQECWTTVAESDETFSSKQTDTILETHNNLTINNDLQKMRLTLKESYDLFQSVGDRFETINFGCLKSRIKDLHLNDRSSVSIKTIVNDLKNSFDEKYMENRLNDLTKDVTTKFRNHPGEFGDIPELSEFFRTCKQLHKGLEKLQKQRNDIQDLSKCMTRIAEISYDRVNEIQKKIKMERNEQRGAETKILNTVIERKM